MKNWKSLKTILPLAAAMLLGHAAFGQSQQQQTSSAQGLPKADTLVSRQSAGLIGACATAVEELKATRELVDAMGAENTALKKQLATTKQSIELLNELNETRKSETASLRETVTAKNEAIAAKDAVIASQDKLIEALKKKRSSPWKRIRDVLIGAAIVAVLR